MQYFTIFYTNNRYGKLPYRQNMLQSELGKELADTEYALRQHLGKGDGQFTVEPQIGRIYQ
mgnify:CR=1 FL=1